jgi:hypothetical protein
LADKRRKIDRRGQFAADVPSAAQASSKDIKAFVPLKLDRGEAFQFDWSEECSVMGGVYRRMKVSRTSLCASRAICLAAYPSQGHEMLFDAHTRSFAALGGVAKRAFATCILAAVDKVKKRKGRIFNARFTIICAHYLVYAGFCNVASSWENGVAEIEECKTGEGEFGSTHRPVTGLVAILPLPTRLAKESPVERDEYH